MTILQSDLEAIAGRAGVEVSSDGDAGAAGVLEVAGLESPDSWWKPDLEDVLPSRPRGDYRERTVNLLVRDAIKSPGPRFEVELYARPGDGGIGGAFYNDSRLAGAAQREQLGELLHDHFVIETAGKTEFLFPFHSDLPGNYRFSGRYKMFTGLILAFLAKPGDAGEPFNTHLLDAFYGLFNDESQLSLLDRQALRIAREHAGRADGSACSASAETLVDLHAAELTLEPFFPTVHKLAQDDLLTAIRMESLGRKDRITAVLTVFYLHLALYFWRTGYVLEEQASALARYLSGDRDAIDDVSRASDATLAGSPFRGKLLFRVSSAKPRTVRVADPCAQAFRELNNRRLTSLPVNTSLLATTRTLLSGAGDVSNFGDAARLLEADENLRRSFDGACRLAAYAISERLEDQQRNDLRAVACGPEPGFHVLREAFLKGWRSELRRSTTDITASLMRRGGKGISATRGKVQYFELGQDLLLLLTKLVTAEGGAVRYSDFLERISLYGLAPQDDEEEQVLADVLRSLHLLEKYSDTGEAMYVEHFL